MEPAYAELRPTRRKLPVLADAKVMLALRKNVQLHGYAGPLQGKVHDDALVRWAHRVVGCMDEHDGGRVLGNMQARPDLVLVLHFQEAGIAKDREIRPAARIVDPVNAFVGPFRKAGGCGESEVPA